MSAALKENLTANAEERIRGYLEDDGDVIEKIIEENSDLIQDYRFKYMQKSVRCNYPDQLAADFGNKVLDLIDRKLNDMAEQDALKEIAG